MDSSCVDLFGPTTAPTPPDAHSGKDSAIGRERAWIRLVRAGEWQEAAWAMDALEEPTRSQPAIRFVRARVALALSQHREALPLLEGLEMLLPSLSESVVMMRGEALLGAGSAREAALLFSSQPTIHAEVMQALSWEKAGRLDEARRAIDRAIARSAGSRSGTGLEARAVRARVARAARDRKQALVDLRFLASAMPPGSSLDAVERELAELDPSSAPTASAILRRAMDLADRGFAHEAMTQMDRVRATPGRPPSEARLTLARAHVLYRQRDRYAEAAELFERTAELSSKLAPEALFHAARAWTRADQNERGLVLYQKLMRQFPRSPWSADAAYQCARLLRLAGRWSEASHAYDALLGRYSKQAFVPEARYEHALCLLLDGQGARASKRLSDLTRNARDETEKSVLRHLQGVALQQAGQLREAAAIWRSVIADHPLSWAALAAAARLASLGQPVHDLLLPSQPTSPTALVAALPAGAQLLRDVGLDVDAQELLLHEEAALLRSYGARAPEALCRLYGELDLAKRRFEIAQSHVPAELLRRMPSDATRWAWECLYPTPYAEWVEEAAAQHRVPQALVYAIMRQESAFDPQARSRVGAEGLMQLMPSTARQTALRMGTTFDPEDMARPDVNITLGVGYLGWLLTMFEGRADLAAAAYNAGPRAVERWLQRAGGIPADLWVAHIPYAETRRYVWRVAANMARYGHVLERSDTVSALSLTLPSSVTLPADAY